MTILLGKCLYDSKITTCTQIDNIILQLSSVLNNIGIETLFLESDHNIIWIRDIFIIIDNVCFICNLTQRDTIGTDRSNEYKYLLQYLNTQFVLKFLPRYIKLEGGDIIQDGDNIFLGIGKRTSIEAYKYLKKMFKHKNILAIQHNSLHLDCVFSVLNNKTILYNKNYINNTLKINNYKTRDISKYVDNKNPISLNFLVIGNNIVCSNLIEKEDLQMILQNMNYRVWTINTHNLWKEGGGIRCMSQWLSTIASQKIY